MKRGPKTQDNNFVTDVAVEGMTEAMVINRAGWLFNFSSHTKRNGFQTIARLDGISILNVGVSLSWAESTRNFTAYIMDSWSSEPT